MPTSVTDLFPVGLVAGRRSQGYALHFGSHVLPVTSRRGRSIGPRSSRNWDIEVAATVENGYALLAHGTSGRREGQYRIFFVNQSGQIMSRSQWISGGELVNTPFSNYISSASVDADGNGIVDGSEQSSYQIYDDGDAITIEDRRGRTFNDGSNNHWDVTAAAKSDNGFVVLREGTSRRRLGQYRLWFTNSAGTITSGTSWQSGESLKQQGYETVFDRDLNRDGQIGDPVAPPPANDGEATILISGDIELGATLSLQIATNDPDGNGDLGSKILTPVWESSTNDGLSWNTLATSPTLLVEPEFEGTQIRARVNYVDGDQFSEGIVSQAVVIPESPPEVIDDYANTIDTSGFVAVGGVATGSLEVVGDRDWFRVDLEAGKTYNFSLDGDTLGDTHLYLYGESGQELADNDDYNGFNSAINNYQATVSGSYYLGAAAYADSGTGTYLLSASEASASPSGYSSEDGYGQINLQRAFQQHLSISLDPVDDLGGDQWWLDNVNIPEVWNPSGDFSGASGAGTVVAVVDTGVDLDHREFQGRIVGGYDFVGNDSVADDGHGHGTHVAGIIAAANDGRGVTGAAYSASIMPIRVLDNSGSGSTTDVVAGIRFAADNGANVINLSLGGGGSSRAMADAVQYASDLGSVVVMAAGNSGGSSPEYPAAYALNYGLAVGAVDQNGDLASFSNRSGDIELDYVTAPGVNIYSSIPDNRYASYSGTSMATPVVAAAAAILSGHDSSLGVEAIEDLLTGTASNSSATSSSASPDGSATGEFDSMTNYSHYITSSTVDSFSADDLTGTFIGRMSSESALSCFSEIDLSITNPDDFGWERLTNNLYAFELGSSAQNHSLISGLLESNQFDYFEVDRTWSIGSSLV